MLTIIFTDSQVDDLLHALDWAIDASDSDMGDPDAGQPTIFKELRQYIIKVEKEQS